LAHLLHILEMVEQWGPALGEPYTAPMGEGLFEIRAKGKEGIGRFLFSFIKKTQKTPKKDLDLAKKRMKEIKR